MFRLKEIIPSLHHPVYMLSINDPVKNLLSYISQMPITTPLSTMHTDTRFVQLAEKVTAIIHSIYPMESTTLGMYCDSESFSLEGTNTLTTQNIIEQQRNKIIQEAQKSSDELMYEHQLYDDLLKKFIHPKFSARWFNTPAKFYETGPPAINMPTELIGMVLAQEVFHLDPSHEQLFDLKLEQKYEHLGCVPKTKKPKILEDNVDEFLL